jgi:hypothetical protein
MLTAVLLVRGSPRTPTQPQSTCAARVSPAALGVAAVDVTNCDAANIAIGSSSSAVATAASVSESAPSCCAHSLVPAAATVNNGSRVRIENLQVAPQMNGRTGIVCGDFDEGSERWTVDVAADGARPACRGRFRTANLRLIPSHNFSTEWVDEGGRVWPKNVDFSRQCAKGHALAPLGERGGLSGVRLMCRLCHSFCGRGCDEAASWLMCSEHAGCCGEYAVCCSCASSPMGARAASADSDDFCSQVRCSVAGFV